MHKLTVFPLGNADTSLVTLDNGQKLLFDYANMRNPNDKNDLRTDLPIALKNDLGQQDYYDVVAFTHADNDHVCGASSFFYLDHDGQYQDGERIKIRELWVPAALIVETGLKDPDAKVLQAEARYRLRQGVGIRIFSRPKRLKDWCRNQDIDFDERRHLMTDAGQCVPNFTKDGQGVEFFVHSPFAVRVDENTVIDRNDCSLVFQATFNYLGRDTRLILSADATHEVLSDMVAVTRVHGNEDRLAWDIFKLPHHCSYLSLSNEKGSEVTVPVPNVKWLFEQGADGGKIVSTSWPIPLDDTDQPPHRQAANYYRRRSVAINGEFKVTMEHPTTSRPEPLVININNFGATIVKRNNPGSDRITGGYGPRAG